MIKKLHKLGIAVLAAVAFSFTANAQGPYTFSTENDTDGWGAGWGTEDITQDDTEGVSGDGAMKLVRKNNNSNIGYNLGIDADTYKYIKIRYKNLSNATSLRIQGSQDAGNTVQLTHTVVSITPNLDEYLTIYVDMTGQANWSSNNFLNLDILVREQYNASEGAVFFDEIEFVASVPPNEFSEFVKNPNFEDTTGDTFLTQTNQTYGTRSITSTEAQNGIQSLKFNMIGDQTSTWWTFSNYTKTYGTTYPVGTDLEVKVWVKTNRTGVGSEIKLSGRVKLTNGGVDTATKPIATVTTTNTVGGWEEITLTMTAAEAFDGVQFWFSFPYGVGEATNLLTGNTVYLDNMTATVTSPSLSYIKNTLEGVSVATEDGKVIVSAPNGSEYTVYTITGAEVVNESLTTGIYIVKVEKDNKIYTTKVIVE